MNNSNNSSKTLATPIKTSMIKSKNRIVEVRVNNSTRAAAASLSSRPSRSLFKTKSLVKPLTNNLKKNSPANS